MGKRLVAFAALGLGAAGLVAGPARADVIAESGTPVTFTGGCMLGVGVLNSTSTPDRGSLTVRPESVVNFVNRLGTDAVLHVGGSSVTVPADHTAPVTIHRGPVEAVMEPQCSVPLNVVKNHGTVVVNATAPRTSAPALPTGDGKAGAQPQPGAPAPAAGQPGDGHAAGGSAAPTGSPAADPTEGTAQPDGAGIPAAGNPGTTVAAPGDGQGNPVAVQPIVKAEPLRKGATGLLALIAAVLLFGVGAAVIRTIVAQRGARPAVA